MTSLAFSSEGALVAAISADLVPAAELALPVERWQDDDSLWIRPEEGLSASALERLAAVGVRRSTRKAPPGAKRVGSWLEAVAPIRVGEPDQPEAAALLRLRDDALLLDVASELLRLGCDRLEYMLTEAAPLMLVDAPPYYTLLRAMDGGPVVAFAPGAHENVWIEVGWTHPLASRIAAQKGSLLLVSPAGWTSLPHGAWQAIDELVEVVLPGTEQVLAARSIEQRIVVKLRLARTGSMKPPVLWVVRERPLEQIERMLGDLPTDVVDGLLFAAGPLGGAEAVVLRAREGSPPVELALAAERYAPHPQLPALLLPCDASLEPPLSRARLRELLEREDPGCGVAPRGPGCGVAPRSRGTSWLRPTGGGAFELEHAGEDAFRPLGEWVEYIIHRSAAAIEPWVRSAIFDLAGLERADVVYRDSDEREPALRADEAPAVDQDDPGPMTSPKRKTRRKRAAPAGPEPPAFVRPAKTEAARAIEALERRFLELDAAADAPERLSLWRELADAYGAAGRRNDAAQGFVRLLWERGADVDLARSWLTTEGFTGGLPELLAIEWPSRDDMRALVALIETGREPPAGDTLVRLARFVDTHQENLDVRGRWLLQLAVSRAAGGDALRLTRVRDRALGDLRAGLSLDHDVPAFLRARATGHGDLEVAEALSLELESLWGSVTRTKRKRSAIEAPEEVTASYARRLFAYGFARLGMRERAHQLMAVRDEADKNDAVHATLIRIFDERVRHAVEGLSPTTPLSGELTAALNELGTFERYKVDRLREASRVLEPVERLDAVRGFQRGEADPRGDVFASMRSLDAGAELSNRVETIVNRACAADTSADERARLLDGAMDFFYALPVSLATAMLERLVPTLEPVEPVYRALLLDEALVLAAHFGHEPLIDKLSTRLEALIRELGPERAPDVGTVLEGTLRTLRRVGLRERAAAMLETVARLSAGDAPELVIARVHLAGGFIYLGETERASPLLAGAEEALAGELAIKERLELTRALAGAAALLPVERRIPLLRELAGQLGTITDSFSTNSHFCLSLLHYLESLVTGLVPPDRGRDGPAAAYLDADEHLVRRRIHRDLREALS